jgi:hypothetical protein
MVLNERPEDFLELFEALRLEYYPQTRTEWLLVERIATCVWKLKRILAVERAEAARNHALSGNQIAVQNKGRFALQMAEWHAMVMRRDTQRKSEEAPSREQVIEDEKTILNLQQTNEGVQMLILRLQAVRDETAKAGCLNAEGQRFLVNSLGKTWELLVEVGNDFRDEEKRKTLLGAFDMKLAELAVVKQYIEAQDKVLNEAELRKTSVPVGDFMERIRRYEINVERQLYRAMDRLERLRARRDGEWHR